MKGNVIQMNTLHLNSVRLNGIGKVQSVSLKGGSTEDPVFPPVEPPIEPEPTPTYTLSASVTNGKVSAKRNGSAVNLPFTANEGDTIVVEVTPNDGYEFNGWADGNTDNPRSITMTADVVLSAECVEVVQPPVGKYIQFEDPAVEAICVANWSSDGIGLTEEDAAAVTTIGTTFKGNTDITSFDELRYFTRVTTINANAFKGCTALRTISFEHITKVGNDATWNAGAFDGCTSLERAIMPKVTEIANRSFANCSSLAEAYMPNVTLIGSGAFKGTRIGGSHTVEYCQSIGAAAFMGTYIEEIIAPSLTSITGQWDSGSFADCRSLKTVRIGDATTLGERTFLNCSALETFIISATTPPSLNASLFSGTNSTFLIYVPDASLEAYKTALNWVSFADRIHPLSEIEGSPYLQFEDAEVERVLMANGVSSDGIGITKEDAASVTSISTWFKGNTAMTSFNELKYFTGVTELTSSAMQNCSALVSANLDNIQYLRGSSLNNTGIDKMYLPSAKTIAGSALSSGKYSVILLGKNLTNIENYAIRINSVLHTAICLAETPPTFGSGNFTSVNALASVYVPDASVETYKTASGWSGVASKFKALSQLATDNPSLYSEIEKYL